MKKSLELALTQARAYSLMNPNTYVAVLDKAKKKPVVTMSSAECIRLAFDGYRPVGQYLDGIFLKA